MRGFWVKVVVWCSVLCLAWGLAESQQPDRFDSLLASAQQAQARSDFQSASEFYQQAVALHPELPELQANLGLMYYQIGQNEQAAGAFRRAIRLKPALFVPNLFLGLVDLRLKRFEEAIPHLKQASLSKPADIQVQLGLAQAYAGTGDTRLEIGSYWRALKIEPENADAWYRLGVAYLEQVESDARILFARHGDSGYLQALVADTFAEQRALIQADDAYKKALALKTFPPGTHANYAFVLMSKHDLGAAEHELSAELASSPGSLLAKLGMARLHLEQGATEQAAKEIGAILKADIGFLRSNAVQFNAGLPPQKRSELQRAFEGLGLAGDRSQEVVALFGEGPSRTADSTPSGIGAGTSQQFGNTLRLKAAAMYASGKYRECAEVLAPRLRLLQASDLRVLASAAFLTGAYRSAFEAGEKLAVIPGAEDEGLYWKIKSAQKLSGEVLTKASEFDSSSPRLHILLGDIYRQRKNSPDAIKEYRKALALQPQDTGALFGLSLALLADGQTDEALRQAQAALANNPDDAELNAVMGEILCTRNDFAGAEGYLKKSLNTKPEYVPHVHALLGKVYAQTNRTQQAIAELKLALPGDKDGHLHYQIARLYLKVGDRDSAKQAFDISARIRREGLTRAAVAMQQGEDEIEPQ